MIFKEIDNTRDVGVICHYLKYLNDSFIGWYPIMVVIDEVASALKMDRDVLVSG